MGGGEETTKQIPPPHSPTIPQSWTPNKWSPISPATGTTSASLAGTPRSATHAACGGTLTCQRCAWSPPSVSGTLVRGSADPATLPLAVSLPTGCHSLSGSALAVWQNPQKCRACSHQNFGHPHSMTCKPRDTRNVQFSTDLTDRLSAWLTWPTDNTDYWLMDWHDKLADITDWLAWPTDIMTDRWTDMTDRHDQLADVTDLLAWEMTLWVTDSTALAWQDMTDWFTWPTQ